MGALGVLGTTTNKTGTDLRKYRVELMEVGNAFSGILANMGRAPEQQGTTIREFLTKMIKADKTAEEMLDANLARNKVRMVEMTVASEVAGEASRKVMKAVTSDVAGSIAVTSKSLSKLMQTDVVQAVDLMSDIVGKNLIGMDTMVKVFNGRYALIMANMLKQITGDMAQYNAEMQRNADLTADSAVQAQNLNNELKQVKNEFLNFMSPVQTALKDFADGYLGDLHKIFAFFERNPIVGDIMAIASAGTILGLAITGISAGFMVLAGIMGATLLPILAVSSAISAVAIGAFYLTGRTQDLTNKINDQANSMQRNQFELSKTTRQLDAYKTTLESLNSLSYTAGFESMTDSMQKMETPLTAMITQIKELKTLLNEKPSEFVIDEEKVKAKSDALKELGSAYGLLQNVSNKKYGKGIENLSNIQVESVFRTARKEEEAYFGNDKIYLKAIKNYEAYAKAVKALRDDEAVAVGKAIDLENSKAMASAQLLGDMESEIRTTVDNLIASTRQTTVDGLIGEISKIGPVAKNYMLDIVNGAKKLGIQIDVNKIKNKNFIISIAELNQLVAEQQNLQDQMNLIMLEQTATSLVGIINGADFQSKFKGINEATKKQLALNEIARKMEELKNAKMQAVQNMKDDSDKKNKTSIYEIGELNKKYELSLARVVDLGINELSTLYNKRKEMEKIYNIEKDLEKSKITKLSKDIGVNVDFSSLNSLLKTRDDLVESIKGFDKQSVSTETSARYKKYESLRDLIDALMASSVEYSNSLKESDKEIADGLKEQISYYNTLKVSFGEMAKTSLNLRDIQIEILKLTGEKSDVDTAEIELLNEKYRIEKSILDMKQQALLVSINSNSIVGSETGKKTLQSTFKGNISYEQSSEEMIKFQKALGMENTAPRFGEATLKALSEMFQGSEFKTITKEIWDTVVGLSEVTSSEIIPIIRPKIEIDKNAVKNEYESLMNQQSELVSKGSTLDVVGKKRLDDLKELYESIATGESMRAQWILDTANKEISIAKDKGSYLLKQYELEANIAKLNSYTSDLFASDNQKFNSRLQLEYALMDAKSKSAKLSADSYNSKIAEITASSQYNEAEKLILTTALEKAKLAEQSVITEENKLNTLKLQNEQIQQQYELSKKVYSSSFGALESLAKGEMPKFDMSQFKEGAINALVGKTTFGREMKRGDYAQVGGYGLGLLNEFMQTSQKAKSMELDYESKILDLRMQGATTEAEKLAISKLQLENQKAQIDAQMKQQTGFLGATGATGGALQGAFSGLASGLATGNWIQAGIGAIAGFMGGAEAKKNAERQKAMLDEQKRMADYLEESNRIQNMISHFTGLMASQGSKLGTGGVKALITSEMVRNPKAYNLSGQGYVQYSDANAHKFTKTRDLSSYGATAQDLSSSSKVAKLQADMAKERQSYDAKLKVLQAQKNELEKGGITGLEIDTNREIDIATAEIMANIKAIMDMEKNVADTLGKIAEMRKPIFQSYFGATLKQTEDTKEYYADWFDMISSTFESVYAETSKGMGATANYMTKSLFSGLSNMFIREGSKMYDITDRFSKLYTRMGNDLSASFDDFTITRYMNDYVRLTKELKEEQKVVNQRTEDFMSIWINRGGALSDVVDSMNEGMKGIYDTMLGGIKMDSFESMAKSLGDSVGSRFIDAWSTKILDGTLTSTFEQLYKSLSSGMEELTIQSASNLFSSINSASVMMENERRKISAISDLFNLENNITYQNSNENINYSLGSSKSSNYYVTNSVNITADFITADSQPSIDRFVGAISDSLDNYNKYSK